MNTTGHHQTASNPSVPHRPHTSGSFAPTPQPVLPPASTSLPPFSHGPLPLQQGGAGTSSRTLSPKRHADHETLTASASTTLQGANDSQSKPRASKRMNDGHPASLPRKPVCKFFTSKKGCRAGDACPFRHETLPSNAESTTSSPAVGQDAAQSIASTGPGQRKTQSRRPPQSTAKDVAPPRPVAQSDRPDQRAYQISQLRIRFSAVEEPTHEGATVLKFGMPPSDPDFPFDIRTLDCVVTVPAERDDGRGFVPFLGVTNREMERGYQLNVEHGFNKLWGQQARPTLLNTMKLLDKQLESLLTAPKAEVIKIVASARSKLPARSDRVVPIPAATVSGTASTHEPRLLQVKAAPTAQRLEAARAKRATETQMLEHRLARTPMLAREAGGTIYTVPVEPRKRHELPTGLEAVKSVRLYVPEQYDVEPCGIGLLGVDAEASKAVEAAFAHRAKENNEATLMAHVNYLAQNMHLMATEKPAAAPGLADRTTLDISDILTAVPAAGVEQETMLHDTDKAHVKRMVRPPEWDAQHDSGSGDDSDEEEEEESNTDGTTSEDEQPGTDGAQTAIASTAGFTSRNTGILLTLPGLQLHNIELLELTSLSLTVKCNRCRESHAIIALKPTPLPSTSMATPSTANTTRTISCRKCSQPLTASYTPDLLHANTTHAAHLDLDNCDPLDLLPSNFTPTCAACSTTHPSHGISSMRGASDSLAICRGCHSRMLFALPSVHFLRLGGVSASSTLPRKATKPGPAKEKLGIVAGTPLPDHGACTHYRKSHRWFRFSCCNVVHPCDKCHDAAPPPPNTPKHILEFANRMICGYCSREQNYRPENCGTCGASLVGRKGRGFWEGGEGTRDPARMSRKDPRKRKLATRARRERAKAKERNER